LLYPQRGYGLFNGLLPTIPNNPPPNICSLFSLGEMRAVDNRPYYNREIRAVDNHPY